MGASWVLGGAPWDPQKTIVDGKRFSSDGRFIVVQAKQREEVWRRVGSISARGGGRRIILGG